MSQKLGTIVADFETSLATKLAIGATSGTLQNATDDDGVALPTGRYFLTIDGNNSSKEHIACTLTGTALTSIVSVSRQGVETSGVVRAHRVGAKVVITDFANLLHTSQQIAGTESLDSLNPLIYDLDPTITDDKHIATKKYVDDTAISGSPLATQSVNGITKLSVAAVSATDPIAVGDNDTRLPTQDENDALVGTSGTPSSSNKFITEDDVSETNDASSVVRRDSNSDVIVATTPTDSDAATSKTYVDSTRYLSSSTTFTTSIPAGANFAIVQCHATYQVSGSADFNLFIDENIGTARATDMQASGVAIYAQAVWSGGSLIVTCTNGTNTPTVKINFYK